MIQAGLLGNGTDQARAVQPRAGTENMTFRKAALLSDEVRNDVTRVGDIDDDALEAAGHDLGDIISDLRHSEMHFIVAVPRCAERNVADSIDDDVAVCQFFIAGNRVIDTMRHEHDGIHHILPFTDQFFRLHVA